MNRIDYISSLFTGASQRDNFQRLDSIFPVATMTAAPAPFRFAEGRPLQLPDQYSHDGTPRSVEDFLSLTETMALLIIEDGAIRFERYAPWGGRVTKWVSMSVAKSFVSAAIGIAVQDGFIDNVGEPITAYLPALSGSAYDGVPIRDILQMSSGARWNEDYSDPESDINRFAAIFAQGGSFDAFPATLSRERASGSFNLYNSTDTQVLGMLLVAATGRTIADYMQEKLWHPLGMEADGQWLLDSAGMEMAFAGLNAVARDYAKLGELFRNDGLWQGRQVVPAGWVKASLTADGPHLQPGDTGLSDSLFGYGYQWWLTDGEEGEFAAIGVYNQFIYVNPAKKLVIVKLSSSPDYGTVNDESTYREYETISLFRAIGEELEG
ncbi:beta-lactamase family protein [Mesorhizobium sp. CGMCC 1.15528]|uniref:Beta-lactamase family protein n=1 Tax=Mesorhizobium zhangyense TaxID=1776730 RepID=A0A7C9VGE6_9HYPH|nr:serine hydrolase domain-containing protein [Mesorhizobium zhangyense]NGN44372.1 beta-lactamase family protein [Mesorhizobium zhangyense]